MILCHLMLPMFWLTTEFGLTHADFALDKPDEKSVILYISSIRKHIVEKAQATITQTSLAQTVTVQFPEAKSPTHPSSTTMYYSTPKSVHSRTPQEVAQLTMSPVTKYDGHETPTNTGMAEVSNISGTSTYAEGDSTGLSWTWDAEKSDSAPEVILDVLHFTGTCSDFIACCNRVMAVLDVLLYSST